MTTDTSLRQRARELLAAEYEREGIIGGVREGVSHIDRAAVRAIEAALAQSAQQAVAVPEGFDITSETAADSYEHGWNACRETILAAAADRAEAGELPELPKALARMLPPIATLDALDDDDGTGRRPMPILDRHTPSIAEWREIHQWLARAASCGGGEVVPGVVWGDGPHEIAPGAVLVKRGDEDAYIRKWGGRRVYLTTPPTPSAGVEVTEAMVTKAARALCKRTASACNVNEEDSWAMYGHEYKADAFAALTAALEGGK